jgi:hypothetical protein
LPRTFSLPRFGLRFLIGDLAFLLQLLNQG